MKFFVNWYEKHGYDLLIRIYVRFALRNSEKKVEWLRLCGAKIGDGCKLCVSVLNFPEPYMVEFGNNIYIAASCLFLTHDGAYSWISRKMGITDKRTDKLGTIIIGDNCFIGEGATIMPNVTVGKNCIIGAKTLVSKSIEDNSVVGGNPARYICSVDEYIIKNSNLADFTCGLSGGEKRKYYQNKLNNK